MTTDEQIAAFLAKRGATRIAEGTATMSTREWQYAVRGEQSPVRAPREDDERVTVVTDHLGREHMRNAHGEWLS